MLTTAWVSLEALPKIPEPYLVFGTPAEATRVDLASSQPKRSEAGAVQWWGQCHIT